MKQKILAPLRRRNLALAVGAALASLAAFPALADPMLTIKLFRDSEVMFRDSDMSRWADNYVEIGAGYNSKDSVRFGQFSGLTDKGGRALSTTVTSGLNFFGRELGGGDSTYDPTNFVTKIRSVGVWFNNYDASGLSNTPRVYLLPVGADVLRAAGATDFGTRQWQVVDQALPVPFPIGPTSLSDPDYIPANALSDSFVSVRRFSRFRAYHDSGGFNPAETTTDSRLIGRSVWNTRWLLIIPGETLQANIWKQDGKFIGTLTAPSRDNTVVLSGVELVPA